MDAIMALFEQLQQSMAFYVVSSMVTVLIMLWVIKTLWQKVLAPAAIACRKAVQPMMCKVGLHDEVDASNGLGGENHDSYRTHLKCSRSGCTWEDQRNQFRDAK